MKKKIYFITWLGFLAIILNMQGCSRHSYSGSYHKVPENQLNYRMKVAVLPMENLTTHPNAGIIITQLIMTELYRLKLFNLNEESVVRNWLNNHKINVNRLTDITYVQKVGQDIGVDAMLIGSVSEYGYQHGYMKNLQLASICGYFM